MTFPLCRLPLLAIREVIKSMVTREIFYLSVISKKSQNFVILSIPKNSFSAEYTFKRDGLIFELMPKGFIKGATDDLLLFCGFYVKCEYTYTSEVDESIGELFYYFSKTFKKSRISMKFEDGTREEFAMNILRFSWENGFQLDHIGFHLNYASAESIQELLNGCNKDHTVLHIGTTIPRGFKCTPPPGGYKFKSLTVFDAHWVNLDDFLQCRKVIFITEFPDLTVEYLNGLLKKIANLECRLESFLFQLERIEQSDFAEIVRGLNGSAILQTEAWQRLYFERKDGLKLHITLSNGYLDLENDYL